MRSIWKYESEHQSVKLFRVSLASDESRFFKSAAMISLRLFFGHVYNKYHGHEWKDEFLFCHPFYRGTFIRHSHSYILSYMITHDWV